MVWQAKAFKDNMFPNAARYHDDPRILGLTRIITAGMESENIVPVDRKVLSAFSE
jgi:hypothetical protein